MHVCYLCTGGSCLCSLPFTLLNLLAFYLTDILEIFIYYRSQLFICVMSPSPFFSLCEVIPCGKHTYAYLSRHFLLDSISKVLCYSFTSLPWKHYGSIDADLDRGTSWHFKLVCGMLNFFPIMFDSIKLSFSHYNVAETKLWLVLQF